ncbi:MAG: MmgE/PrpD family protein, partial [Terriglobia bacterium]
MSQAIGLDRPAIKESATQLLAQFLAGLRFEALPPAVVSRTEEAFLDWFGCAL